MTIYDCIHQSKKRAASLACIGLLLFTSWAFAEEADAPAANDTLARSIVEKADKVRFPGDGFQVDIVINSTRPDKEPDIRKFRVLSKGNENTVVMITEPASERGQVTLMKGREPVGFHARGFAACTHFTCAAIDRAGGQWRSGSRQFFGRLQPQNRAYEINWQPKVSCPRIDGGRS